MQHFYDFSGMQILSVLMDSYWW